MSVDVDIDYKQHLVVRSVTSPRFTLNEVMKIDADVAADMGEQWVFAEDKWKKLVASNGDWSSIGISLKTNSPVPGFDRFVQGWRSPRVKIPH